MKLASRKDGTRDGHLVLVSRNLKRCVSASHIAATLQGAIDGWNETEEPLQKLSEDLERDCISSRPFREHDVLAPLPRAYQWLGGSAYLNHMSLARRARGARLPADYLETPIMYQGGSDSFMASHESIIGEQEDQGIDFEAEVAIIVGDVPQKPARNLARDAIRLIMLANDLTLRNLLHAEFAQGLGFIHCKPPTAFSPVAVTPDELGDAWDGSRLERTVCVDFNDQPFGRANAGIGMAFDFPQLICHAAATRPLAAGTIIGSGTVSNEPVPGSGYALQDGGPGHSCIIEKRAVEQIASGSARTPFMRRNDKVRIWMTDSQGHSIFGSIQQRIE